MNLFHLGSHHLYWIKGSIWYPYALFFSINAYSFLLNLTEHHRRFAIKYPSREEKDIIQGKILSESIFALSLCAHFLLTSSFPAAALDRPLRLFNSLFSWRTQTLSKMLFSKCVLRRRRRRRRRRRQHASRFDVCASARAARRELSTAILQIGWCALLFQASDSLDGN